MSARNVAKKQYMVFPKDPADKTTTDQTYAFLQSCLKADDLWYDEGYPYDVRCWLVNANDSQVQKIKTGSGVHSIRENRTTGRHHAAA